MKTSKFLVAASIGLLLPIGQMVYASRNADPATLHAAMTMLSSVFPVSYLNPVQQLYLTIALIPICSAACFGLLECSLEILFKTLKTIRWQHQKMQ